MKNKNLVNLIVLDLSQRRTTIVPETEEGYRRKLRFGIAQVKIQLNKRLLCKESVRESSIVLNDYI